MLTFEKRWQFQDAYSTAVVDVLYDDDRDEFIHLIRDVNTLDGESTYPNVNLSVRAKGIPEDVVKEAIRVRVHDVIKAGGVKGA